MPASAACLVSWARQEPRVGNAKVHPGTAEHTYGRSCLWAAAMWYCSDWLYLQWTGVVVVVVVGGGEKGGKTRKVRACTLDGCAKACAIWQRH